MEAKKPGHNTTAIHKNHPDAMTQGPPPLKCLKRCVCLCVSACVCVCVHVFVCVRVGQHVRDELKKLQLEPQRLIVR